MVDRIFSANAYFIGLNYEAFIKLLYGFDPVAAAKLKKPTETSVMVRFAQDIVAFHPERRALYKSLKIGNGVADYFFETPYMEKVVEEPVYGSLEDGSYGLIRVDKTTISEPDKLNFDEFVADVWSKGVRFGIDANAVKLAVEGTRNGRILFAHRLEPVLGKAADIEELAEEIRRDDAPMKLADGRVDLRQFKNRFPQINKGVQLIKKIPLVLGETGYELSGNPIEPPIPKDIHLESMAGPGTAVEIDKDGNEFIVSQQDGFLSVDEHSNQISIVEKIISRDGVSARTTGNLVLTGEEFEEHGEVQEKRTVEGNSVTIHANVYGTILSRGGKILLKSNLVGGMAINEGGDIIVEGLASSATLHTKKGEVALKRAENCIIIGTKVTVGIASNCTILADEVVITEAHGCAIAAKGIKIDSANTQKQIEMLVFVLVPDMSKFDQLIGGLATKIDETECAIGKKNQEMEKITNQPELRNYLLIGSKLKKNEIVLSPEQLNNFQKLATTVSPVLKLLGKFRADITALQTALSSDITQRSELMKVKKEAEAGIHCAIAKIVGETVVRTITFGPDGDTFHDTPIKNLKTKIRGSSALGDRVFVGKSGSLNWKFATPHPSAD